MSKHSSSSSVNYWPGYVDALTNVVMNMLFALSIFCVGVFSLGLLISRLPPPNPHDKTAKTEQPPPGATSYEPGTLFKPGETAKGPACETEPCGPVVAARSAPAVAAADKASSPDLSPAATTPARPEQAGAAARVDREAAVAQAPDSAKLAPVKPAPAGTKEAAAAEPAPVPPPAAAPQGGPAAAPSAPPSPASVEAAAGDNLAKTPVATDERSESKPASPTSPPPNNPPPASPTPGPAVAASEPITIDVYPRAAPAAADAARDVKMTRFRADEKRGAAEIQFSPKALRIEGPSRQAIVDRLAPLVEHKADVGVAVFALIDRADAGSAGTRAAYYRLRAVGDLLLALGVPADKITLRLQGGAKWQVSKTDPIVYVQWAPALAPSTAQPTPEKLEN